jgi:hypothetical protein
MSEQELTAMNELDLRAWCLNASYQAPVVAELLRRYDAALARAETAAREYKLLVGIHNAVLACQVRDCARLAEATATLDRVRKVQLWSPQPAEPERDDDGPLYQGFMTDQGGQWIRIEDLLEALSATTAQAAMCRVDVGGGPCGEQEPCALHSAQAAEPEPDNSEPNCCEHGDHPAPEGKRFCSKECAKCEQTEHDAAEHECARLCLPVTRSWSDLRDERDEARIALRECRAELKREQQVLTEWAQACVSARAERGTALAELEACRARHLAAADQAGTALSSIARAVAELEEHNKRQPVPIGDSGGYVARALEALR